MSQKSRLKEDEISNDVPKKRLKQNQPVIGAEILTEEEKERILKLIENQPETEKFDEHALKKLIIQLDKKVNKNQEMRIKFSDNPLKFMDSEIELNDIIQDLHIAATRPDLYHILLQTNCIQTLLGLLSHENTDISVSVINLIEELTDVESLSESIESAKLLVDALFEQQIISLLVSNLERFDETHKDEADGVHNALGIFENMTELKPTICIDAGKQGLLQWLLKRIKVKGPFDINKLYSAEILSILVQNEDENRKLLGDLDGIDILLQQLAHYKKHEPGSLDELEYMENLFDCLCSCLMLSSNRTKFLVGEGLQLMRLMLREQKSSRNSALKILTYAMNGNSIEGKANCQTFVDILGLGVLFPLFMKPPKRSRKGGETKSENEEYIISIIASLLKNCTTNNKQRVLQKFLENDHEKVDRLIEIYFKYLEKVNEIDDEIEKEREEEIDDEDEDEDEKEVDYYMRRLDGGLFTLQLTAYVILDVCEAGEPSIKLRVKQLFNLRNASSNKLKDIVKEYINNMTEEQITTNSLNDEKQKIKELIDKF